MNKPLPWYVVLSYTGTRLRNCPKCEYLPETKRDFEDNLEAEGLYKLNTTYHETGTAERFCDWGGLASAKRELLLGGSGGMPPVKF